VWFSNDPLKSFLKILLSFFSLLFNLLNYDIIFNSLFDGNMSSINAKTIVFLKNVKDLYFFGRVKIDR